MRTEELTKRLHDLRMAQEIFIRQGDIKSAMIMTVAIGEASRESSNSNRRARYLEYQNRKRHYEPARH